MKHVPMIFLDASSLIEKKRNDDVMTVDSVKTWSCIPGKEVTRHLLGLETRMPSIQQLPWFGSGCDIAYLL